MKFSFLNDKKTAKSGSFPRALMQQKGGYPGFVYVYLMADWRWLLDI